MNISGPLFSIVVPVYNTEKYIDQCLQSLVTQTQSNIEIIVVDDGSTDSSGALCDEWALKDERIRVVHQPNSGVVKACRTGFDLATGLYFSKVDSDDWVEPDFCEVLGNYLLDNELDMIISNYLSEREGEKRTQYKKNIVMTGYELVKAHGKVHTTADICYSCRMIFNVSFLRRNNLFFGENMKIGEDTVLNLKALSKAERVMAVDYAGYHYRDDNETSVMRSKYKPTLERDLIAQYSVRGSCFSDIDSYMYDLSCYYINTLFYSVLNNCKNSPDGLQYADVRRILNTNWVKESFKLLGFKMSAYSGKEYVLLCIAKLRFAMLYYLIIRAAEKKNDRD